MECSLQWIQHSTNKMVAKMATVLTSDLTLWISDCIESHSRLQQTCLNCCSLVLLCGRRLACCLREIFSVSPKMARLHAHDIDKTNTITVSCFIVPICTGNVLFYMIVKNIPMQKNHAWLSSGSFIKGGGGGVKYRRALHTRFQRVGLGILAVRSCFSMSDRIISQT